MAKKQKPKKKPTYTRNPGLSGSGKPTVIKSSGERILAQSELDQLLDQREKIAGQLDEVDKKILGIKEKRRDELLAELKDLGLDELPRTTAPALKGKKERQQRSCKTCVEAGHPELSKGHVARGHVSWLAKQPDSVKALFQ